MNGFDYAAYLKKHLMVGEIDPWRKTDEGKSLYALLVPVEMAMDECSGWSGQDIDRRKFITYLKTKDILVLSTPEDLVKLREEREANTKIVKAERKAKRVGRQITDEERKRRSEQMKSINVVKDVPTV